MKAALPFLLLALCAGCRAYVGKKGFNVELGLKPPTNAVVRVTVKKIGVHIGQNPATQTPEVDIGYSSATYDRVPLGNTNVPAISAEITTTQSGFSTTISEKFSTGSNTPKP